MTTESEALAALRHIADGDDLPCRDCGKVHELRRGVPTPKHYGTWADPDDGHAYNELSAKDYARRVLAGIAGAAAVDRHAGALRLLAEND